MEKQIIKRTSRGINWGNFTLFFFVLVIGILGCNKSPSTKQKVANPASVSNQSAKVSPSLEALPLTPQKLQRLSRPSKMNLSLIKSEPIQSGIFEGSTKVVYNHDPRYEVIERDGKILQVSMSMFRSLMSADNIKVGNGLDALFVGAYTIAHPKYLRNVQTTADFLSSNTDNRLNALGDSCVNKFNNGKTFYGTTINNSGLICRKTSESYIVDVMPKSTYDKEMHGISSASRGNATTRMEKEQAIDLVKNISIGDTTTGGWFEDFKNSALQYDPTYSDAWKAKIASGNIWRVVYHYQGTTSAGLPYSDNYVWLVNVRKRKFQPRTIESLVHSVPALYKQFEALMDEQASGGETRLRRYKCGRQSCFAVLENGSDNTIGTLMSKEFNTLPWFSAD